MESVATPAQNTLRPYLVLALGIFAVSMAAIFIKLSLDEGVPALVIAAGRLTLAALVLTPVTLRRYGATLRKLTPADFGLLAVSGVFLAAHFASWVSSLQYTSVLISVVLVTTTPIWVGVLEVIFLRARLSRLIVLGMVIAVSGGAVIAFGGTPDTSTTANTGLGAALSLIGAVTVAVYLIIGRKYRATLPLLPYIWIVYGVAAIVLVLMTLITAQPITGHSATGYLWIVALALIPQLVGHSSLNYALAYLPATYVSLATQIEPIGSAIMAFFLFSETPGALQIVGSLLILAGVTLATLKPKPKPE